MPSDEEDEFKATSYQWTCPACQASRSGIAGAGENWESKAVESLRTHIRGLTDDAHGPHGAIPPELEGESLRNAVDTTAGP